MEIVQEVFIDYIKLTKNEKAEGFLQFTKFNPKAEAKSHINFQSPLYVPLVNNFQEST